MGTSVIRWLAKWAIRLCVVLLLLVAVLVVPVAHNELACSPDPIGTAQLSQLPPEHHRSEARTLLTYPEWHIVHAYDDYAKVIATDDPHRFGFWQSITEFWSSLCSLSKQSAAHGGFPFETKQMVYVIGVSFSAEMGMKALYEEIIGRIATWVRGPERSVLDNVSARQTAEYAQFLQQVPWYKWDFAKDKAELSDKATSGFRDVERRIALGGEYAAKAAYAKVIAKAVDGVGADALTLRMIVRDISEQSLLDLSDVQIIAPHGSGYEIETPRYRVLTHLIQDMAQQGANFVEIAGNDDIMLTALSASPTTPDSIHSFARQGYSDTRHLILLRVSNLAEWLRTNENGQMKIEHIHDY